MVGCALKNSIFVINLLSLMYIIAFNCLLFSTSFVFIFDVAVIFEIDIVSRSVGDSVNLDFFSNSLPFFIKTNTTFENSILISNQSNKLTSQNICYVVLTELSIKPLYSIFELFINISKTFTSSLNLFISVFVSFRFFFEKIYLSCVSFGRPNIVSIFVSCFCREFLKLSKFSFGSFFLQIHSYEVHSINFILVFEN